MKWERIVFLKNIFHNKIKQHPITIKNKWQRIVFLKKNVTPPPWGYLIINTLYWLSGIVVTHICTLKIDQYSPPPLPGLAIRYCDHTHTHPQYIYQYPPPPPGLVIRIVITHTHPQYRSVPPPPPPPGLVIRHCDHAHTHPQYRSVPPPPPPPVVYKVLWSHTITPSK